MKEIAWCGFISAVIAGVLGVTATGCSTIQEALPASRIPFTSQMRSEWNFTDAEIKGLQFYTHDTVVLERDTGDGNRAVAHGKLVVRSGHVVEQIEIPAGTPGVATAINKGSIDVCFEGDCQATLTFENPQEVVYGTWFGGYAVRVGNRNGDSGIVNYGAAVYTMKPLTYLEIDEKSLRRCEERRRVVKGKKIDG